MWGKCKCFKFGHNGLGYAYLLLWKSKHFCSKSNSRKTTHPKSFSTRSWQNISCPWDTQPNHWPIRHPFWEINELPHIPEVRGEHSQALKYMDWCTGSWYFCLTSNVERQCISSSTPLRFKPETNGSWKNISNTWDIHPHHLATRDFIARHLTAASRIYKIMIDFIQSFLADFSYKLVDISHLRINVCFCG